jgi:hypothetical protein
MARNVDTMRNIRPAKGHVRSIDPLLNADIYIPTEPGLQKRIAANVSIINEAVSSFRADVRFIPCPDAYINPNDYQYQHYLDVYEANQNYYIINRKDYDDKDFYNAVRELEDWFVRVVEPCVTSVDYEGWCKRERKRITGISHYCAKELRLVLKRR